jgi:RimJ/RimL family protein N-acetyltransferase
MAFRPEHCGVEIGGTWYAAHAQGGIVNPTCKYLLLGHAFDSGAERVELKTDSNNVRSRAAMLKMGARFEGVHRHHMRRPDGTWRDTAWFSVLRAEWPDVREGLVRRITTLG